VHSFFNFVICYLFTIIFLFEFRPLGGNAECSAEENCKGRITYGNAGYSKFKIIKRIY